jgi:hypothetical protein
MVMAKKLTRLTHKIAIQLPLVHTAVPFTVLAPGDQSGNFWLRPHMSCPSYHSWFNHSDNTGWRVGTFQ